MTPAALAPLLYRAHLRAMTRRGADPNQRERMYPWADCSILERAAWEAVARDAIQIMGDALGPYNAWPDPTTCGHLEQRADADGTRHCNSCDRVIPYATERGTGRWGL